MGKSTRWFEEGAKNLRLVLEGQGRGDLLPPDEMYYTCPCCLTGLYSLGAADKLTIEHVPPEILGGRPMLLTCARCNSNAGANFDSHADQKVIADAFVRGAEVSRKIRATAYIDGVPLRGAAQSSEDGISIVGVPKQNNREQQAAFVAMLESLVEGGSDAAGRFSFTINTRFDESRARLSIIRSAYLAAFAALGWSYILQSEMQQIRDQLMKPDDAILDTYVFRDPDSATSVRRMILVADPDELRCLAVTIGEYSVFLPGWPRPKTWDETSATFGRECEADGRLNLELKGKEVPWPKKPMYFLDSPPSSALQTAKPSDSNSQSAP